MSTNEPVIRHTATREDGSQYEVAVPKRLTRRFERLCKQMAQLLEEIQEHCPEANLYLEGEGYPHLLVGPSHTGRFRPYQCQENILVSGVGWPQSGGGGW